MKSRSRILRARHTTPLLVLLLVSLLFPAAAAAGSGACTTATIDEPFRLPTGRLHAPARLTLCERGAYSPISSFHEVKVEGSPVALLISRHESSEAGATEAPFLMFLRNGDGSLTLLGYAFPSREGMRTFAFGPAAERVAVLAKPMEDGYDGSLLLVAAQIGQGSR